MVALVPDLQDCVWYDPNAMTNIISQLLLKKQYRITYDKTVEDAYFIHMNENEVLKFTTNKENGLYIYTPTLAEVHDESDTQEINFAETV